MRGIRGALMLVVLAACSGGGTEPAANGTTGGTGGGGGSGSGPVSTTSVTVEDNQFTPKNIAVAVGATVTWTWSAAVAHDVTFGSGKSLGCAEDFRHILAQLSHRGHVQLQLHAARWHDGQRTGSVALG